MRPISPASTTAAMTHCDVFMLRLSRPIRRVVARGTHGRAPDSYYAPKAPEGHATSSAPCAQQRGAGGVADPGVGVEQQALDRGDGDGGQAELAEDVRRGGADAGVAVG